MHLVPTRTRTAASVDTWTSELRLFGRVPFAVAYAFSFRSMDGSDPFLSSNGDSTISFSFTGRNGSFRSPSALGIPIVLGSFNGGQSFGAGKSYGGMSISGKSFTGSNTNWGRVKSNIMKKEAEFVSQGCRAVGPGKQSLTKEPVAI